MSTIIEKIVRSVLNREYKQINGLYESITPEELKRLRRIQEVRNTIDFQTEVQDPCNFDDGEEYADFCIGEGLSFFYGDEGYEREDEIFQDEEEDHLRDEITEMIYKEYFNYLSNLWDENKDEYDC
jgi:hypothetical protein